MGLIIVLFVVMFVALLGFKLIPAYIDFYTAKKAINAVRVKAHRCGDPQELRPAPAIVTTSRSGPRDRDHQGGHELVVGFAYRKECRCSQMLASTSNSRPARRPVDRLVPARGSGGIEVDVGRDQLEAEQRYKHSRRKAR